MPISKHLQPSDWVMLVKSMFMQRAGGLGFLQWVLQQQHELQHMGADHVSELLMVACSCCAGGPPCRTAAGD
jgi:hypothetical protein